MQEIYLRILESNLINFIIMLSILVLIFKKAHLGLIFDKMADDIRNSVNSSAQAAKNALETYKTTRKEARDVVKIKDEIIKKAQDASQNLENTASLNLEYETKTLDKKFEAQSIKNYTDKKEETAKEIYKAVVLLTEEEILKRLDYKLQRKLVEQSINEINNLEEIKI